MLQSLIRTAEKICDRTMDLYPFPAPTAGPSPFLIAHRGAWDMDECRENTLEAFRKACEQKVWGIEYDIHFTLDDIPVVHHDCDLKRVFNSQHFIRDHSFKDLRAIAPHLPTMQEALGLCDVHHMIEVKTQMNHKQQQIFLEHLKKKKPIENFHLLSLQPDLFFDSNLPRETWVMVGDFNLAALTKECLNQGFGGVAGHYLWMTRNLIEQLHKAQKKCGVGFVPTPNLLRREWVRGVDWAFTNSLHNFKANP